MASFIVNGGKKLEGSIRVSGAKNSILPLLAATVLTEGTSTFVNCPQLSDVNIALDILTKLGSTSVFHDDIIEVYSSCNTFRLPRELMVGMRGSVTFLGPILATMGMAEIYYPGGCKLGSRPIDIHISALKSLGAKVEEQGDKLVFKAEKGLHGTEINFRFPSVGATENIIMAASLAEGVTVISGAAREPEIVDLALFLNRCGAEIYGAGQSEIVVVGKSSLHGSIHRVIPDRILAATLISACAVTAGHIEICGVDADSMKPITDVFISAGVYCNISSDKITVSLSKELVPIERIVCAPHPSFPTDAGPLLAVVLAFADGVSEIFDSVFENRFSMADQLSLFGCNMKESGHILTVNGGTKLHSARVTAGDLRGGAAALCFALACKGISAIDGINHIDRGYPKIEKMLGSLGADIRRTDG